MKQFQPSMHTYRALFFLAAACFGFLCALLLYSSNKNAEETIYLENKRTLLSTAYTASIQGYRLSMEGMFRNMPAALELLAKGAETQEERDKASQELYRTLEGLQETLQHLHLQQMHYHLGDGSLFLSFPQSSEQSAAYRSEYQVGIDLCNKERRVVHGVSVERFFFGVHYMFPLIRQGQHVGCVEVNIAFNTILSELKTILPDQEYAYIINKKHVDPQWLTGHSRLYTPSAIHDDYLTEDGSAHLHTSPPPLSSEAKSLNLLLQQEASVRAAMDQGAPVSVVLRLAGTTYTVSLLPLHGVDTQVYGYLIAYAPDPILAGVQRAFYVAILTGTGAFILFLFLFFRLGRYVRALNDKHRTLGALNEALSEGVCVHDSDGAIILVNPATCRILGRTEAELLGRTSRTLFGDDDVAEATKTARFDEDERLNQYDGEQVVACKDGEQRRVRVSYRPILEKGRMAGAITTLHDLTAQKQLEEELRRSEKNSREAALAIEQSPVSILITNTLGLIEYANAQLIQLSGYSMEEMRGRHFRMMTSGETPEKARNALWEALVLGRTWQGELIIRHKNGQTYRKLTFIAPMQDDEGTITHYIAIPENLPEHRRVEQENETISSTLIESLPVGLVIIDEATRVIEEVNSMAATMFGAERSAIVGTRCRQFLCPTTPDPCPADARDFIRADTEKTILRADGSRVPILKTIRKITIRDRAKLLECFIDIHEQKQVEEALHAVNRRLEEANRNKSSFLAHMSHEIRTPMNAIIGMTHLAMQTDDSEKRRHFLTTVQDSAENLLGLLNDILDFSKMEVGQLQLSINSFSPSNLIDEVLATLRLLAEQKKLLLHAQIDENVPSCLRGDDLRLRQIFTNLVGNAVKFTHEGSVTIRVRLESEPDSGPDLLLHCVVSDTGIGIAADKQASIFNSFE
jgi:PAS domain S-box-containing protein